MRCADHPLSGSTYGCALDTTTLADGDYQLRALITSDEGRTRTTAGDPDDNRNTAPTGSMSSLPASISGNYEVQGYAEDRGSGVASWTLQLAPAGSETWRNPAWRRPCRCWGHIWVRP